MAEENVHPDNYCAHLILTRDWSEDTMAAKGLFPTLPLDAAIRSLVEEEFKGAVEAGSISGQLFVEKIEPPKLEEVENPDALQAAVSLLGMCREILLSCNINDASVRESAWNNLLTLFSQFPKLVSKVALRCGQETVYVSAEVFGKARDAMLNQKKVDAIKIIRQAVKIGLKEAKELVEDPTNFKQS